MKLEIVGGCDTHVVQHVLGHGEEKTVKVAEANVGDTYSALAVDEAEEIECRRVATMQCQTGHGANKWS